MDVAFVVVVAAVLLWNPFTGLYAITSPPLAILGQAMWTRVAITAALSIGRMEVKGLGFWPNRREFTAGRTCARRAMAALGERDARRGFEASIAPIWSDAPRLSSAAYFEENKQFHDAVTTASGNSQLAMLSRQLQLPLIMFQVIGALTAEVLAASVAEHRRITTCILDGDAAAAEREVRRHLERAAAFTRKMPSHTFRPSGGAAQGL